eukprot:9576574-Alexandrium_andersonii.AAC.1
MIQDERSDKLHTRALCEHAKLLAACIGLRWLQSHALKTVAIRQAPRASKDVHPNVPTGQH